MNARGEGEDDGHPPEIESERERETERRRKKREYFAMREERRRFPEARCTSVCSHWRSVRSRKSLPTLRGLHKPGGRSERGREKRSEEGCGERRKMAVKGGDGGSSLRAKTRSIDRLSIDDPTIQEEFVTFDGDCLPEGETLSLEQAARPTGEKKKKKSFGCSPWMTSGGDFSTRIPLFSPRNNRLVLARPTR